MNKIQIKKCYPYHSSIMNSFGIFFCAASKLSRDSITIDFISDESVVNFDIYFLGNFVNLQYLRLYDSNISDISPLENLVNLEKLDLSSNQVSDISPLKNLVNLKELNLHNNPISQQQIRELKEFLPNCKIYY